MIKQMKVLGIATRNVQAYFELLNLLREKRIPFEIFLPGEEIPPHVGAVITTREESISINFQNLVIYDGKAETTVLRAMKVILEREIIYELVIGIDPGEHIGLAAVGDGAVLGTATVFSQRDMLHVVRTYLKVFPAFRKIIRVGHGDITKRNKIISLLWKLQIPIEIVDERNTTTIGSEPDIEAAVKIAMQNGKDIAKKPRIHPTAGEIRNIQRISRIKSNGALTISKKYAAEVAMGKITIEEAIEKQKKKLEK
ncbi:MAG: hypothetical protein ACP5JR_03820 [Thermoplasmata archaeon]